jgi:PAS domain S-box-containing protein
MTDPHRTNQELIEENTSLKQKIKELEHSESERQLAEQRLQESESKLNAMLQSMPDHMSMMDKELNLVWANEAAKRMFGNDIIGRKCYEAYHRRKEPCEPYPCLTLKAFNDGGIHEHETDVVDAAGKAIYFHCTATVALRDKDEKPITVIEISRDITEHKQAEEKLLIQYRTFQQVLNGLNALVYVADMKTYEIVFMNTYGREILGDITGKICWQAVQKDQTGACQACTNSRLIGPDGNPTEGIVWEFQNTITKQWYDCREKAIYWPDGRILRMEIAIDITARKHAENALRESEERFRTLSDKAPLGMSLIDIDGRYEYVNPAFVKIFGYDLCDIPTGKEWFRNAYPDAEYRREGIATWKYDLSHEQNLEIRPRICEVRCKEGAFKTILFRAVSMTTGKQLIIYEDITERKQTEETLKETLDQLESRVRERTIELEETNTALRILLKKGEADQKKMEETIQSNVNQLVTPFMSKLRKSRSDQERQTYLNILETNLDNIVSPFINRLSAAHKNLTPKEIQIAEFIKQGKGSKEIAELFGISVGTVLTHRNKIRKKLDLNSRDTNLRSHLLSLG